MPLKDFRPGIDNINDDINTDEDESVKEKTKKPETQEQPPEAISDKADYHKDIDNMNIKKLSRRITIIAVLLPCILGAILFFSYINIKNANVDKQSMNEKNIQNFQEQIRGLNVKLEKMQFDMENKLAELEKKSDSLEKQITQTMAKMIDSTAINDQLKEMNKSISSNAEKNKVNLKNIKKNQTDTANSLTALEERISLFKQEMGTELAAIKVDVKELETANTDYKKTIQILNMDLSIMDKKFRTIEQDIILRTEMEQIRKDMTAESNTLNKQLSNKLMDIDKKVNTQLYRIQKEINALKHKIPTLQKQTDKSENRQLEQESLNE